MKAHLKKNKKIYTLVLVAVLIAAGWGVSWLNCPEAQFKRYCEGNSCSYAQKRLNKQEKKAFVAMKKYLKETGKQGFDDGVLKYVSVDDANDVLLKMRAASADVVRQELLDKMAPREKFPGNYDCMRRAYVNGLSDEEVLFIQSLQGINLNDLAKNPALRQMYLVTTPKIMRCMNDAIQQKYLEEIKALTLPPAEEKKPEGTAKKETKKK